MNKKFTLIIILLVLAMSLTLVACDGLQNLGEHQHTFSDKWTYDEYSHWRVATCEHSDETDGKAAHNFGCVITNNTVTCLTCGYSEYRASIKPEPPHEHSYASEYSANGQSHWLATTCGHEVENAAPHNFADGVCATCGWWSSATDVLFANLSKSDVFNYAVLLDNVCVNAVNLLDGEPQPAELTISGELQLSLSADGQISGRGYFHAEELSLKAVVSDGTVYAVGEGNYLRCELNDLLMQNGVDIQSYLDQLNANTQQIREYFEQITKQIADLPLQDIVTTELWNNLVKVDEAKSTDGVTAYVLDNALLRQLNQVLSTITVEEYANAFLSELNGTPLGVLLGNDFNDLPDNVYSLLSRTIFQTITELWSNKFTLDDLFKQINGYVARYYPDDKVNTIDDLIVALGINLDDIAKQYGINLKGATVKQLVEACSLLSPETLWNLSRQDDSEKISAREINVQLSEICENYADKTVYDIVVASVFQEVTADYIKTLADSVIDLLDECVTIEFYVDDDGVLQQIDFAVTSTDITFEQAEIEQLKQLLAKVSGTVTLKRDYQLEQDYSQVIEQVEAYYNSL